MHTECWSGNLKGRNHVEDIRRWENTIMLDVQRDRVGGCGSSWVPKKGGDLNNQATINFSRTNLHCVVSSMQFTANIHWLPSKSLYI
jgi:hypothetical protein